MPFDVAGARQAGYSDQEINNYLMAKQGTNPNRTAFNQLPSNNSQTLGLINQYFPQDQVRNAYNIMMLESHGFPRAVGDTGIIPGDISQQAGHPFPSYGLYQVRALPGRPSPQQLYDPRFNIEYAANLYRRSGWQPWYNSARKLGIL